jgi:hypothetical protein
MLGRQATEVNATNVCQCSSLVCVLLSFEKTVGESPIGYIRQRDVCAPLDAFHDAGCSTHESK